VFGLLDIPLHLLLLVLKGLPPILDFSGLYLKLALLESFLSLML
jgi:hypothetical protein